MRAACNELRFVCKLCTELKIPQKIIWAILSSYIWEKVRTGNIIEWSGDDPCTNLIYGTRYRSSAKQSLPL